MENLKKIIAKHNVASESIAAFLIAVSIIQQFNMTKSRQYLLAILVFVAVFVIVHFGVLNYSKRRLRYSLFYCVPFGLAFWLGQKVVYRSMDIVDLVVVDIVLVLALIALFTLMSICVLGFIDRKSYIPDRIKKNKKSRWWVFSLIILLCYMPLFLAFFPGIVSNDSAVQLSQAVGEGGWSNWHPVLHTLFVAIPVNIGIKIFGGDLTAGIALSTLLQMLILVVIFGYVVKWMIELTQKKWIGYVLLVFFAICPIVACYAVTMWKDVMFSSVFLLLFIKIYDLVRQKKREELLQLSDMWLILLLVLITGFLRNGGILIVVMFLIAMWVYYKDSWKLILTGFGGVIMIMIVIQGPIYGALNIISSPLMESLSVPAQQFAYVAANGKLDDELRGELIKYADVDCLASNYSPMNADPAKNCFNYKAVDENKIDFLLLWTKTLPRHLSDYMKSYLLHTYAYWYIQGDVWALDFGHSHDEMWMKTDYTDVSLIGDGLKNAITKIEEGSTVVVWVGWMNNVGIMSWSIYYALMVFMYKKYYAMLVPMSGILIYMFSLLIASPISWMFRYVYSLLLILPTLIIICFINNKNLKGEKK